MISRKIKQLLWCTILCAFGFACENAPDRSDVQGKNEVELKSVLQGQQSETYALLSAKYDLDTSTAKEVVEGYFREQDPVTYLVLRVMLGQEPDSVDVKPKYTPRQSIDRLASKYSIPAATVASLIIDYRTLRDLKAD